jgi:hypothetical protein
VIIYIWAKHGGDPRKGEEARANRVDDENLIVFPQYSDSLRKIHRIGIMRKGTFYQEYCRNCALNLGTLEL